MEFAAAHFHLGHTLDSGQAFRWKRQSDGSYTGVIGNHVVNVEHSGGRLIARGAPRETIETYFVLHEDLPSIVAKFPDDPPMRLAVKYCYGMRLLRQDKWEALASFICSANKQIVQIRQMVANLCKSHGVPLPGSTEWFSFPVFDSIARSSVERLLECKLGFRAKNLLATARMIDSGEVRLDAIEGMDYPRAVEELCRLPGVGPKIADCALLFGWGRQEAFPLDVWIQRSLRLLYFPRRRNVTRRQLIEFHRKHFGPYGGYAQQYLFHYVRNNPEALKG